MPSVRTSICLFCVSGLVDASAAHAQTQSRHLLAISDIDMMATSYHDDQLGPPLNQVDTLSIFDLASHSEKAIASTPASVYAYFGADMDAVRQRFAQNAGMCSLVMSPFAPPPPMLLPSSPLTPYTALTALAPSTPQR